MGVSTNSVAGAAYTWASSGFAWNDTIVAQRAWTDANKRTHSVNADDPISIVDGRYWSRTLAISEAFAVAEKLSRKQTKKISEALGVAETYIDYISYWLRIFETAGISDSVERNRRLNVGETLSISESLKRNVGKQVRETLGIAELFGRTATYSIALAEGLSVSDALKRATTIKKSEAIQVFEEYPRNGNSVISDLILSTDELTLDAFRTVIDAGHAPGYQPFRDFIPGDYTYQKAVFRAVMESSTSDRAKLVELTLQVDVPDVTDRGSAAITNATTGVRVTFNRQFYTTPEVTLTLKGGSTFAIPRLLSSDNTGFTAVLRDPDTSNNVTGTFTWAAQGY